MFGSPNGNHQSHRPTKTTKQLALPETEQECLALARRLAVENASQAELVLALRALERAETLRGGDMSMAVAQARVLLWISRSLAKTNDVVTWLDRGDRLAKRISKVVPHRVEGHYYRAAFWGFRAQMGAVDLLPQIVEEAQIAVDIDETYDDAGPLVLLGMVLLNAPGWPHGPGDPEEGLALLKRAVKVSDFPYNRMLLGTGLIEQELKTEGCAELERVFRAPRKGRWALVGQQYRDETRLLMQTHRCPRKTSQ